MSARIEQKLLPLLGLGGLLVAACSQGFDRNLFAPQNTPHATLDGLPLVVSDRLLVYLADEASTGSGPSASTDLNGDGDTTDAVAIVVDIPDKRVTSIGVAALDVLAFSGEIYLVVSEADDGTDHDGDGDTADTVLFHFTETTGLTLIDTLRPAPPGTTTHPNGSVGTLSRPAREAAS